MEGLLSTGPTPSSSLINWLTDSVMVCGSTSSKYSQHHESQTVRARELKFWETVHHVSCVMWHMSRVLCQVSSVTCHMSFFFFFCRKIKLDKVVELVGGGSVSVGVGVGDGWHVTGDRGQMTKTDDTWHVTHDTWHNVNILSKFQLSSSNGLGFMMLRIFGGSRSTNHYWISHLMKH